MDRSLWFKGEKWLVWTGILGFVLAVLCGVGVLVYGVEEFPGKGLVKAASFNAALGLFLISTAAIIPLSGLGRIGRAVFRWSYIALGLFAYFAETVQNYRGVNPRFVEDGSAFDIAIANAFGTDAMLLVVFYVFLGAQFFRKRTYQLQPTVITALRYAMIAIFASFMVGFWIGANQGRYIGLEGNLIWLHGMGFHALQALPFIAWLAVQGSMSEMGKRLVVHVSGVAFLFGLLAMGWQTYEGRTLAELSLFPLAALACYLVVTFAGVRALLEAVRGRNGSRPLHKGVGS
ncbi:hypothetical protein ACFQZE_13230 [Paenibacillus sp. GCM10027627]|uniref:hypothetical protein n=1 Tax=unclassified Paenibacillus TaxID=185978 RepID=UPI0036366127